MTVVSCNADAHLTRVMFGLHSKYSQVFIPIVQIPDMERLVLGALDYDLVSVTVKSSLPRLIKAAKATNPKLLHADIQYIARVRKHAPHPSHVHDTYCCIKPKKIPAFWTKIHSNKKVSTKFDRSILHQLHYSFSLSVSRDTQLVHS